MLKLLLQTEKLTEHSYCSNFGQLLFMMNDGGMLINKMRTHKFVVSHTVTIVSHHFAALLLCTVLEKICILSFDLPNDKHDFHCSTLF